LCHCSKNERYEWFQSYDGFRHLLTAAMLSPADGVNTYKSRRTIEVWDRDGNIVPRNVVCLDERPPLAPTAFPPREHVRVLVLGCGNSSVAEAMLRDGWTGGIVNVDFSDVVIEQMKARYDEKFYEEFTKTFKNTRGQVAFQVEPMEFCCADVTKELPFEDGSFDLIICKGTLDAILSSSGSVVDAKHMMHECCRLLRDPHGAMVVVTHASPDNRIVFFENRGDEWWAGINVHTVRSENREAAR
jgi:SAM-dependent methyltransferase